MMSTLKLVLCALVLLVSLISSTEGSCWRYGHSCWGGHGKRSGSSTTPRDQVHFPGAHPKVLAGLGENALVDMAKALAEHQGDGSHPSYEYMNSDESTTGEEEGLELYMPEKNMNDNDLIKNRDEIPGVEEMKSEAGLEKNGSWEDESRGSGALNEKEDVVERTEIRIRTSQPNPLRINWILYKLRPLKQKK